MRYFTLNDDKSLTETTEDGLWAWRKKIFGNPICSVARTQVGNAVASAVFLGTTEDDKIEPYEVLAYDIKNYKSISEPKKYATWDEAEKAQKELVKELTNLLN
jgi:hypothetical protein